MKKIYPLIIIVVILLFIVFIGFKFVAFEHSQEFYDFPIPRSAKLVKSEENSMTLKWSGASEENGISKFYALYLSMEGWKEKEREGASVIYEKEGIKIDLISVTNELIIIKNEK